MSKLVKAYELIPENNWQKSFYHKAVVKEFDDGCKELWSYHTRVAECKNGIMILNGYYSATTWKHIHEFMYQNGINVDTNTKAGRQLAKNAKLCNDSDGVLIIKDGKVNVFSPKGSKKKNDRNYYSDIEDYERKRFYERWGIEV